MNYINNNYVQALLITSFLYNSRSNLNSLMGHLRTCKCIVFFSKHIDFKTLFQNQIQAGFNVLCLLPAVSKETERQLELSRESIKNDLSIHQNDIIKLVSSKIPLSILPQKSVNDECILETITRLKEWENITIDKSRVSGTIYSIDDSKTQELILKVFEMYYKTNPLHPDVFPSLRSIETWLIRYSLNLFNAPNEGKASITSGGTESIFLACKAYRDYYKKPFPEIIVPSTVHPAFDKACDCLGIKLVKIPVDFNTSGNSSSLDLSFYESSINENTILLVGSAPSFPHGEMDPMRDICNLGEKYNLPVHMDACLGGFVLAFLKGGEESPDHYDFSMKGITSISADFHKYALSEKGISIVMYNSVKYIESQYFVYSDWCGGIYATNTLLGSRPGSIIAITWAGMLARGFDYYRKSSLDIVNATRYIAEKLEEIPEVTVIGDPKMLINVVAFNTPLFDIYSVNSELKSRGWNLNPLQFPSSLHICITNANSSGDKAKEFIKDVKWAVNKCRDEFNGVAPEDGGSIYGTSQKITNRSLVSSVAKIYLNTLYFP